MTTQRKTLATHSADTTGAGVGQWRRRAAAAVLVPMIVALMAFFGPSLIPTGSPAAVLVSVPAAEASPMDCYNLGRSLTQLYGGNWGAALNALRRTPGCGDSLVNGVCWTSRQPWGGWARDAVHWISRGASWTC